MTTISIAMATYNGAKYILQQLSSLSEQTFRPTELVICDDQSTDTTLEIINTFKQSCPFNVRVTRNADRLGYRANFMKAAALCESDLIAFCDQDDIWDQSKLAILVGAFEDTNTDLAFHDFRLIDAQGRPLSAPGARLIPLADEIDHWTTLLGLTLIFRKDLLRFSDLWEQSIDQNDPDNPLAHDQWFVFLAHSFGTLTCIESPLLSYRQHESNLYGFYKKSTSDVGEPKGNLAIIMLELGGKSDSAEGKRRLLNTILFGRTRSSLARLEILSAIIDREPLPALQRHIDYYRHSHASCSARMSIYLAADVKARSVSLVCAVLAGAYRLNSRGVRDLILDIVYGVLVKQTQS